MRLLSLLLIGIAIGASSLWLIGCGTVTPKSQTRGGTITVKQVKEGFEVSISQPSNPDESGIIEVVTPGTTIRAGTGSSRKDDFAGIVAALDQYKIFTYVGAGVCVLGVGLVVASFWIPLIPKTAGILVFVGGALTAYMAEAIPKYAGLCLGVSVVGAVIWYFYQDAGKKDPATLKTKHL